MKYFEASPEQIRKSREKLQNPTAHLNDVGEFDGIVKNRMTSVVKQAIHRYALVHDCDEKYLRTHRENKTSQLSDQNAWIVSKVNEIQKNIWNNRHKIWPDGAPSDPVKLLDPDVAIQFIGYEFEEAEFLGGLNGNGIDKNVAGIVNCIAKRISISNHWSYSTQRFTAAHELGHALMHHETTMHRDRPIDGSRQARDQIEIEADKFAALFLMPENLLKERFKKNFGSRIPFIFDDSRAYALEPKNPIALMDSCKCLRDLSRVLAGANYFNRQHLHPLSEQFGVSVGAMAIRLEELGLVEF